MSQYCSHLQKAHTNVKPGTSHGCEDCLLLGETWVHLRICLTCGYVGCCDNSKNKHASAHYQKTSHPVIKSFELGEEWKWCFIDRILDS